MVKLVIKNFFKNLLYIFVPMGIIYLGIILSIYFVSSTFIYELKIAGSDILSIIKDAGVSSEVALKDFYNYSISQINWSGNFLQTIDEILYSDWIDNTINGFFNTLSISTEGFDESIMNVIDHFAKVLAGCFALSAVFLAFLIYLANKLTAIVIRGKIAKRTFKKKIIGLVIMPIINIGVNLLLVISFLLFEKFSILIFILYLLISVISYLVSAWLIQKEKKVKLKEVLNIKNVGMHLLGSFIIIAIVSLFTVLIISLSYILGLLIAIPLFIYTSNIIKINSESYVYNLTNHVKFS